MRHYAATADKLEGYVVEDGGFTLGVWNELGDITADVRRPDGSRGHAYGGPVYSPPEFSNVCERILYDPFLPDDFVCSHEHDLTTAEKRSADALVRRVGWDS